MRVIIEPTKLNGRIKAIASKSQAHRMLICAAFADRPTRIICRERSQDIDATADCLRALGCGIDYREESGAFLVMPKSTAVKGAELDCGESGSTLRFLLPIVCALGTECHITTHGRLSERPLSPLWEELMAHGCMLKKNPDGSIDTCGRLRGGVFSLAADISSQFISGLLFAMPLIGEQSEIRLLKNVESRNYILMTMEAQRAFGVDTDWQGDRLLIKDACKRKAAAAGAYISPGEAAVEGDWSNAAFWLCASRMCGGSIEVTGLNEASVQGDRAVKELIDEISEGKAVIDARNVPDLVPALAVLASSARGRTLFTHAERLRIKESDRIKAAVSMLKALGADCRETSDGLEVTGTGKLSGGSVSSFNDHRIAMSAAIAASICKSEVIIDGAEAVKKSYPDFWMDFRKLGGKITVSAD